MKQIKCEIFQMKQRQTKAKISRFTFDTQMNCLDVLSKSKASAAHKLTEWFNYSFPSRSLFHLSFAEDFSPKDGRQE